MWQVGSGTSNQSGIWPLQIVHSLSCLPSLLPGLLPVSMPQTDGKPPQLSLAEFPTPAFPGVPSHRAPRARRRPEELGAGSR